MQTTDIRHKAPDTRHETRDTDSNAIGIFDSGIGGLTVLREIEKFFPSETLIYLGDTARVPYGTKSKATIERFAFEDIHFLLQKDVKFIIAACNTVSALALPFIKTQTSVPILGVIEPAVKKAIKITQTKRVGVIGTRSTIASTAYDEAFNDLDPSVKIFSTACPLFVPLVEEDWIHEPETKKIAEKYLIPLLQKNIDTLILGCTHYPLLYSILQEIAGPKITLIDSARSTAEACNELLLGKNTGKPSGDNQFFVTDEPELFQKKGEKFLGHSISNVEMVQLASAQVNGWLDWEQRAS